MKAHIVLAHPKPQSFNAKLASISNCALISAVYGISFSDLFSQRVRCCWGQQSLQCAKRPTVFSFANRTALQRRKIPAGIRSYRIDQQHQSCNLLNVNFPLWWFGTPANLKGWIDWVFVYGKVYTSTRSFDNGICRGKKRSHASPRAHLQTAVQPMANRGIQKCTCDHYFSLSDISDLMLQSRWHSTVLAGLHLSTGTPRPTPLRKHLHHDGPTILST